MSPTVTVVLGTIAFVVFWVLAVFPSVPILPIGRTAGSLLGAMLMVIFQVIPSTEAYDSIDLNILGLLFGTMVVSVYLEKADAFKYLGNLLSFKSQGPKDLLCRVCLISALSSAFFTNDTSCMVLTQFVLKVARQHNLPPYPFLLALASSANIGSSATPIGNPQNLVIAFESRMKFWDFFVGIALAAFVGIVVNTLFLLCMFWNQLKTSSSMPEKEEILINHEDRSNVNGNGEVVNYIHVDEEDVLNRPHMFSAATVSHLTNGVNNGGTLFHTNIIVNGAVNNDSNYHSTFESDHQITNGTMNWAYLEFTRNDSSSSWKNMLWKVCVYIITLGMLVSMVSGLSLSWSAIVAALALVVLDFKDAQPSLERVSYSLLVFFCGMFITVQGFDETGIPSAFWELMQPYVATNCLSGVAVLAIVILVLCNIVSNVPTVLLLGTRVAAAAAMISPLEERKAWLILAWTSTVAGNLSLVGSAANLIVCEQAGRAQNLNYTLSFWTHLKFGLPSTLLVTAVGLLLIT